MGNHIIPRFILRGFTINPQSKKNYQKIRIYSDGKFKNELISDAFQQENFYSDETEDKLNHEFENKVAKIFTCIKKNSNIFETTLSISEYKLLIRFFVVMWRRNDIHKNNMKKQLEYFLNMNRSKLQSQYKNKTLDELINIDAAGKLFYDFYIKITNDNDPTVKKTFDNYFPYIFINDTKINFPLHNTYSTVIYNEQNYNAELPEMIIEPISSRIWFVFLKGIITKEELKIKIEHCNDEEIIKKYIELYMQKNAISFIIDSSNEEFVKSISKKRKTY